MNLEYTVVQEYSELQKLWERMGGVGTSFSIFKDDRDEGEKWFVKRPNFDVPIMDFNVIMECNGKDSIAPLPPTWENVAKFFAQSHGEDHIFLEGFEYNETTNRLRFITGS